MKYTATVLLTASLLLNAYLLIGHFNQKNLESEIGAAPISNSKALVGSTPQTTEATRAIDLRNETDDKIFELLKGMGAPDHILKAIAFAISTHNTIQARNNILNLDKLPKWQRSRVRLTDDQRKALRELANQQRMEFEKLYPEHGTGSSIASKLGLSGEREQQVAQIIRDYGIVKAKALEDHPANRRKIEEELRKNLLIDLRNELSESEFNEYYSFYSSDATKLQGRLSGLELTDDEYLYIFRTTEKIKEDLGTRLEISPDYILLETQALIKSLGPGAAATVAMNTDMSFRKMAEALISMGIEGDAIADVYLDYASYFKAGTIRDAHGEIDKQQVSTAAKRSLERLSSLVGEEDMKTLGNFSYVRSLNGNRPPGGG